jgi:hypothetical protein
MTDNCHIKIINNSSVDLTDGKYKSIDGKYKDNYGNFIEKDGGGLKIEMITNGAFFGTRGDLTFKINHTSVKVKFIYECPFKDHNKLDYETASDEINIVYYGTSGKAEWLEEIPLNKIDICPSYNNPLAGIFVVSDKD